MLIYFKPVIQKKTFECKSDLVFSTEGAKKKLEEIKIKFLPHIFLWSLPELGTSR